jgi:hypothetical protein
MKTYGAVPWFRWTWFADLWPMPVRCLPFSPPVSYSDNDTMDTISPITVEFDTNRMPLEDNINTVLQTPSYQPYNGFF